MGFTLIELLTVLAVVGVLAALSLNVAHAAQRRAAHQQARAELATLAAALDAYHRHFGAYPQLDDASALWLALTGRISPSGLVTNAPVFVDLGAFRVSSPDPAASDNHVLDPWGRAYRYRHLGPVSPIREYTLYSVGPDGRDSLTAADGAIDYAHPDNLDNVYADRG